MKILIVSATALEVKKFTSKSIPGGFPQAIDLGLRYSTDFLVTGVGAVPTAFNLAKYASQYDFILNVGIAGTYNTSIKLGQVVAITEDAFGDYGIDDNGIFLTLAQVGLVSANNSTSDDILRNPWIDRINLLDISKVRGLTLATASGSAEVISRVNSKWSADVETMESAAVFYSCLELNKPFLCVRAISNIVEPRNRNNWRIGEALDNLHIEVLNLMRNLDVKYIV